MIDALITLASTRPLALSDLSLGDPRSLQVLGELCDAFARRLAEQYLRGHLSWTDADMAANHLFDFMVRHCSSPLPDDACEVYFAFDAGEYQEPGADATTRPLIEALVRTFKK